MPCSPLNDCSYSAEEEMAASVVMFELVDEGADRCV